jgi:hypothetical protein
MITNREGEQGARRSCMSDAKLQQKVPVRAGFGSAFCIGITFARLGAPSRLKILSQEGTIE